MTQYVLEILDGDQAGTVVPLDQGRLRVGRRPDNELVLKDEKCSGHHAEITFEDGGYVLRDLDSTNGTMIDGKRVSEVALSPFDVVQLGRVNVRFRAEGEAATAAAADEDVGDLRMERVDAARLAKSKRGGSLVTIVLLLLIVGGGGAYAYLEFAGDGVGGKAAPGGQKALKVPGNLLVNGADDFETDGAFDLQAASAASPFDVLFGKGVAHSGTSALRATHVDAAEGDPARRFALARLAEPLQASAGTALRLRGFLRTEGGGQLALRLRFTSSADPGLPALRTGTAPKGAADWEELALETAVPAGMDRVEVEILGLMPGSEDAVEVDDLALLREGSGAAISGSAGNRQMVGVGAMVRIGSAEPTLLGVLPRTQDSLLVELQGLGLFTPSDAGVTLAADTLTDRGFALQFEGAGEGLVLVLPDSSAGVLTRGASSEAWSRQDVGFEAAGVNEVLMGTAESRCVVKLSSAADVRGSLNGDQYRLELPSTAGFEMQVLFTDESARGGELLRDAVTARKNGNADQALDLVRQLLDTVPHDVARLRDANALRNELNAEIEQSVTDLLAAGADAAFFDSPVGYMRIRAALNDVRERYGVRNIRNAEALDQLDVRMQQGLERLAAQDGEDHGNKLTTLADAFEATGQAALAERIRSYVKEHYGR